MIQNLLQINFNTHSVHISRDLDTDQIICFKYDESACDFQSFESNQEYEVSDWIITPIPTYSLQVTVQGDRE
jgi:hypothetical protein